MLFWYELKKILFTPAIVGFVVLCLIVNITVILTHDNRQYDNAIQSEAVNVFDGYETGDLADMYIHKYSITGKNELNVRELYDKLQPIIDRKSANGDALSPYFGQSTYYLHGLLFGTIFPIVIAEGCLFALFVALLSVGYENIKNTEPIICAAKSGRKILLPKLFSSLTACFMFFALIIAVTLNIFFVRFDFSGVWNNNVSSGFNSAVGSYGKPFITWVSITVSQYLWATIGIAILLAVCFCLIGFAVGTFIRNSYASCLATVTICGALYNIKPLLSIGSIWRGALNLTPVWLWLNSGQWFTDGGADIIHAHFECLGVAVSLAILTVTVVIALHTFNRRNLV